MELDKFEEFLSQGNMAKNTIFGISVCREGVWLSTQRVETRETCWFIKTYLIETYKPKTVNLRIQALNKYLVS